MPASLPLELRKRIVSAHLDQGLSEKEVAEIFGVARSSVRRYLAKHRQQESLEPRRARGADPKLGAEEIEWIKSQVEKNTFQSSYDLAEAYNKHFSQNQVHRSTVLRAMKKLEISYKKKPTARLSATDSKS